MKGEFVQVLSDKSEGDGVDGLSQRARISLFFQKLLPQHPLSALAGWASRATWPRPLVRRVIEWFAARFGVNWGEAALPAGEYASFDAFFTRALKPGLRPLPLDLKAIACPVDGVVSATGGIDKGVLFQAKGAPYALGELLGDEAAAQGYEGGGFATLYLSPKDYHRIHSPGEAVVRRMRYVPGALFSVNPSTERLRPRLFSRNERVAVHLESAWGPFCLVMVGALIVGSVETSWEGVVAPGRGGRKERSWEYEGAKAPRLERGAELGRFHLGSTVILLVPPKTGRLAVPPGGTPVRLGSVLGRFE